MLASGDELRIQRCPMGSRHTREGEAGGKVKESNASGVSHASEHRGALHEREGERPGASELLSFTLKVYRLCVKPTLPLYSLTPLLLGGSSAPSSPSPFRAAGMLLHRSSRMIESSGSRKCGDSGVSGGMAGASERQRIACCTSHASPS